MIDVLSKVRNLFRIFLNDIDSLITKHKLIRRSITVFMSVLLLRLINVIIYQYLSLGEVDAQIVELTMAFFAPYSVIMGFYFYNRNKEDIKDVLLSSDSDSTEEEVKK